MLFVLYCRDKPDSLTLRLATRAAHLDYAKADGRVHMAGPMLGDDGEQPRCRFSGQSPTNIETGGVDCLGCGIAVSACCRWRIAARKDGARADE